MGELVKHLWSVGKEGGQEGDDLRKFVTNCLWRSFSLTPDLLRVVRLASPLGDGTLSMSSLDEILIPAILERRQLWDLDGPEDAWYTGLKKSPSDSLLRGAVLSRGCGLSQACWDSLSEEDRKTITTIETSRLSLSEDVAILAALAGALQAQIS